MKAFIIAALRKAKSFIITTLRGIVYFVFGIALMTLVLVSLVFPSILADLFQDKSWNILYTVHLVIVFYVFGKTF